MKITTKSSTVNGIKWHWAEAGDGDPVVLLHGIPESWKCWKHQIPKLATQFFVQQLRMLQLVFIRFRTKKWRSQQL